VQKVRYELIQTDAGRRKAKFIREVTQRGRKCLSNDNKVTPANSAKEY